MKKIKITIDDINESLYDVDSVYREALAQALMDLKYVSDSPLNLSMGTIEQQKELEEIMTRPLKAEQVKEIIGYVNKEMKGDFQFGAYQNIVSKYLNLADKMKKNKEIER